MIITVKCALLGALFLYVNSSIDKKAVKEYNRYNDVCAVLAAEYI